MTSIKEAAEKIKAEHKVWWLILVIVLIGTLGFGLGRFSGLRGAKEPISIVYPDLATSTANLNNNIETDDVKSDTPKKGSGVETATVIPVVQTSGQYVASRVGTKYHYPWCGSAKQIKEENKIWFATRAEAEAAGYTPAGNCPGLK